MRRSDSRSNMTLEHLRNVPGRLPVSVIVTTYNEERNIVDCVESALWADEVFLVDSFSTDRTIELARQHPITIRQRDYYGSAAQKNWSLDRVKNDWVLILDADERVPEELANKMFNLGADYQITEVSIHEALQQADKIAEAVVEDLQTTQPIQLLNLLVGVPPQRP